MPTVAKRPRASGAADTQPETVSLRRSRRHSGASARENSPAAAPVSDLAPARAARYNARAARTAATSPAAEADDADDDPTDADDADDDHTDTVDAVDVVAPAAAPLITGSENLNTSAEEVDNLPLAVAPAAVPAVVPATAGDILRQVIQAITLTEAELEQEAGPRGRSPEERGEYYNFLVFETECTTSYTLIRFLPQETTVTFGTRCAATMPMLTPPPNPAPKSSAKQG